MKTVFLTLSGGRLRRQLKGFVSDSRKSALSNSMARRSIVSSAILRARYLAMPSCISSRERCERTTAHRRGRPPAEAARGNVVAHRRVQLGEAVRELGPVDDLVGDGGKQLLGGGSSPAAISA